MHDHPARGAGRSRLLRAGVLSLGLLHLVAPRVPAVDLPEQLVEARQHLEDRRAAEAERLLEDLLERLATENRRREAHPDAGRVTSEVLKDLSRLEELRGDWDAAETYLVRAGQGWMNIRAYTDFSRVHEWVLGRFYLRAGRCAPAERLFRELLEPLEQPSSLPQREHDRRWDEIVVADRRSDLAEALRCLGRKKEALRLLQRAGETYEKGLGWGYLSGAGLRKVLGPARHEVELLVELGDPATAVRRTGECMVVIRSQLGDDSREYEEWLLLRAGAIEALEAAGERPGSWEGIVYDAAAMRRKAKELRRRRLALDQPEAAGGGSWFSGSRGAGKDEAAFDAAAREALALSEGDDPAPAFGPLQRALALGKRLVRPDDPRMAKLRVRLCKVLTLRRDFQVARRHCSWALDHVKAEEAPRWRAETLSSSALLLSLQGQRGRAIPYRVAEAKLLEELHGPLDDRTLEVLQTVAHDMSSRQEKYGKQGKARWLQVIRRRGRRRGAARDLDLLSARHSLVEDFEGDPDLEVHARDALRQAVDMWGEGSWWHAETLLGLGRFLVRQDRAEEALPHLEEALRHAREAVPGRVVLYERALRICRSRLRRRRD